MLSNITWQPSKASRGSSYTEPLGDATSVDLLGDATSVDLLGRDKVSDFLLDAQDPMNLLLLTIFSLAYWVQAFTDWQALTIRASIKKYGAPDAVFVDVTMVADYAHTDMASKIVSIDARRFDCCPNSFTSVVHHELDHTRGRLHNSIPGDIMSYHLTVDALGNILEDTFAR